MSTCDHPFRAATVKERYFKSPLTETDDSGKQLARVQETVPVLSTATPQDMIRYTRPVGLAKGAALVRITVRDRATNRVGTLAIPMGKQ
jgi:hypothetical protein